jgi:choline dehydrogenase
VEVAPGPDCQTDEQWDAYIRETGYTVHHPVGTCRMGSDEAARWSIRNCACAASGPAVADASVMPSVIGGNTNAPCVMIGERCADFMLGKPALPAAELPPESVARYKPKAKRAAAKPPEPERRRDGT